MTPERRLLGAKARGRKTERGRNGKEKRGERKRGRYEKLFWKYTQRNKSLLILCNVRLVP